MKVGGVCLPVFYRPMVHYCGTFHNDERPRITINTKLGEHAAAMTILHESIHAVFRLNGIEDTEQNVRVLEMGLTALLRDNPELVAALAKGKA